ncbi:MAG: ssDNA-binding domain-containing protein, partial [Coriobacteriales bacterium]|nr:ssDNA-binding domain-containing protein [Coriobacteriales bacterium]
SAVRNDGTALGKHDSGLKKFSKEEYAAFKKAERDDVYAMIEQATERVTQDPVAFKDYLDVMARFERYSVANTLLIFQQAPEAVRVGSFEYWKGRGASVKGGENGIRILEPGDEYTRDDGSIGVSFDVKRIFDEAQTTARHREPRHPEMRKLLFALIDKAPVAIKTTDEMPGAHVYAEYDHNAKTISVVKGLDGPRLFKALSAELAQAAFAERDDFYDHEANRETALFAAYVVAGRYGVDNSGLMPVLVPQSKEGSLQEVRGELSRIRDGAKTISERIDKALQAERGKDEAARQPQAQRQARERGGLDAR